MASLRSSRIALSAQVHVPGHRGRFRQDFKGLEPLADPAASRRLARVCSTSER